MERLIILGAIVFIVLWCLVGKEFRRIAAMKGHDEARYFWWTFLLGIVGMLMVAALPNDAKKPAAPEKERESGKAPPAETEAVITNKAEPELQPEPELPTEQEAKAEEKKTEETPEEQDNRWWRCDCGRINRYAVAVCRCGKSRPE